MELLALVCIIGAVLCFAIETFRSWFSISSLGLLLLSLFFLFTFVPGLSL